MTRQTFIALTVMSIACATLLIQGVEPEDRIIYVLSAMGVYLVFVGVSCSNKK